MPEIVELQKSFEMIPNSRKKILHLLIPILRAPFDAEKRYERKTVQNMDFTGVKIAWVELKSIKRVRFTSSTC